MKHTLYKNCPQVQFVDNLCAICVNPQNNLMSCFGLIDKKIVSEIITSTATKTTATRGNNIKKFFLQHWKKNWYNITTLQHYNIDKKIQCCRTLKKNSNVVEHWKKNPMLYNIEKNVQMFLFRKCCWTTSGTKVASDA